MSAARHAPAVANWTPDDDGSQLVVRGKLAIGAAVKVGRGRLGVSQHTLADHTGVSQPVISRLESGKLNGIRWQTLARIVGVLQAAGAFRIQDH